MASPRIGRRTTMEYSVRQNNYFPARGQVARGATPQFAIANSGCIGAFDTTTLTFAATSLAAGLTTLAATGFLSTVNTLQTGAYDVCQAHIAGHAFTTPSGVLCSQISYQLGSGNTAIAADNSLPTSATLLGLYVKGTMVVYAPSAVSSPLSISVPVTVAFLGDVVNS